MTPAKGPRQHLKHFQILENTEKVRLACFQLLVSDYNNFHEMVILKCYILTSQDDHWGMSQKPCVTPLILIFLENCRVCVAVARQEVASNSHHCFLTCAAHQNSILRFWKVPSEFRFSGSSQTFGAKCYFPSMSEASASLFLFLLSLHLE
jgi:hypothetical protein